MTVLAIIQARLGSSRLPGKVLLPAPDDRPLLSVLLERVQRARTVSQIVLAVPDTPLDRGLLGTWADTLDCWVHAGSETDVLDRFYEASRHLPPDALVVRLTGDNPLVCPEVLDQCVRVAHRGRHRYVRTGDSYPEGLDVEVFTRAALVDAWERRSTRAEREHVTWGLRYPEDTAYVVEWPEYLGHIRVTVDTEADYGVVWRVLEALGTRVTLDALAQYHRTFPEVFAPTRQAPRNPWKHVAIQETQGQAVVLKPTGAPV